MRDAINAGWISDYVVHFSFFGEGDRMDAMIDMLKDKAEYFPMFVYFNSTERCKLFAKKLVERGIKADYLDGKCGAKKRREVREKLIRGEIVIVSLCGVYNEGISIDNIRTVMFGDLRHSDINKVQIMMRACRLHESKPFFRVIVPMTEKNMDENEIQEIVRTFCKVDSQMKKSIEAGSKTKNRLGKFVGGKSYEQIWMERLEQVKDYIDKEGKTPSCTCKDIFTKQLGRWISQQKKSYKEKKNIMKNDKIRDLWLSFINNEKYSKYFISNYDIWIDKLEKTKEYMMKYDARPLRKYKDREISILGSWVGTQIKNYNKKIKIMGNNNVRKLWLDFITDPKYQKHFYSYKDLWLIKLNELKDYIKKITSALSQTMQI
jgi:superfamily II DNA/RNA helicase